MQAKRTTRGKRPAVAIVVGAPMGEPMPPKNMPMEPMLPGGKGAMGGMPPELPFRAPGKPGKRKPAKPRGGGGTGGGKAPRNFKSDAAYGKWLAYGHLHGDFERSPGNTPVRLRGKAHRVDHGE